ncbi:MAG TPA: methyltransferase domain-containing protein [Gemmatimonadales bacterium]|jgi:SAM-dependent methyltransferase
MSLRERTARALAWRAREVTERLPEQWRFALESWLPHNWVYGSSYFAAVDSDAVTSAGPMADGIARLCSPQRCVDVGCGTGAFLAALRDRHQVEVRGFEYGDVARQYCRSRALEVLPLDLSDAPLAIPPESVDLVTSFEVAEHLPARLADRFVETLTSARKTVVMSAAVPGQGGTGHVNEQPREYWIERMQQHRFRYDSEASRQLSEWWRADGATWWYWQNVAVYRPREAGA